MFQLLRGFFIFCLITTLAADSFAVIKNVKYSGGDDEQEEKKQEDEDKVEWGFAGEIRGRMLDADFWLYLENRLKNDEDFRRGIQEGWDDTEGVQQQNLIKKHYGDEDDGYLSLKNNFNASKQDYEAALQKHGRFLELMKDKPWENAVKNKELEMSKEETIKSIRMFIYGKEGYGPSKPKDLAKSIQGMIEGNKGFGQSDRMRIEKLSDGLYYSKGKRDTVLDWMRNSKAMCAEMDQMSVKTGEIRAKGDKAEDKEIQDLVKKIDSARSDHRTNEKLFKTGLKTFEGAKRQTKKDIVVVKKEEPAKEEKKEEEKKEAKKEEQQKEENKLTKDFAAAPPKQEKKEESKKEEPKKEEKKQESVNPEKAVEVAGGALGAPAGTFIEPELEEKLKGEESDIKDSFEQESRQIRSDRNKKLARAIAGGGAETAKLQEELNRVNLELAELREKEEISDEDIARIKELNKRSQEIQKQLLQLGAIDEGKAEKDVDSELSERLKGAQTAHDGKRKDIDERRKKYNDMGFRKHEAAFLKQSLSDDDFLRDLEIAIRTPGAGSRLTKKRMKDRSAMSRVDVNGYAEARIEELENSNLENMDDSASKFLKSYLMAEDNLEKFLVEDFNTWSSGKK